MQRRISPSAQTVGRRKYQNKIAGTKRLIVASNTLVEIRSITAARDAKAKIRRLLSDHSVNPVKKSKQENPFKIKTRVKTSMQIGSHYYNLNEEYYVAGDIGENPSNYARLSSFSDAHISSKTGLSVKYPKYHFDFKLVQYNNFDSGMANIYKLVITITI